VQSACSHFLSASALSYDEHAAVHGCGIGYALLEIEENFGFAYVTVFELRHVVKFTIKGEKNQDLKAKVLEKRASERENALGTAFAIR
jgi:hypothetical protein